LIKKYNRNPLWQNIGGFCLFQAVKLRQIALIMLYLFYIDLLLWHFAGNLLQHGPNEQPRPRQAEKADLLLSFNLKRPK